MLSTAGIFQDLPSKALARPAAHGRVQTFHYDRYLLCNGCAAEYEVGRARGLALIEQLLHLAIASRS